MNKKKYSNEPIGKIKVIADFLPSPEKLVLKKDTARVTILLSKDSLNYFKREAEKHKVPYQTMIRSLLDKYTQHYASLSEHK